MSRRCILHIGSGKTGSSSVQGTLSQYFKNTIHPDFVFPSVGGLPNNQTFRLAFCNLDQTPINIRVRFRDDISAFRAWQASIKEDFFKETRSQKSAIISSEFLFLSKGLEVSSICDFLNTCGFTDIIACCYLRDPSSYFLSVAQQCIKTRPQIPSINNKVYDIIGALESWSPFVSAIYCREFSISKLVNHSIIDDFCELIGINGLPLIADSIKNLNESVPAEAIQVLQDFHRWQAQCDFQLSYQETRSIVRGYLRIVKQHSSQSYHPRAILKDCYRDAVNHVHQNDISYCQENLNIFSGIPLLEQCPSVAAPDNFYELVTHFDHSVLVEYSDMLKSLLY